MGHKISSKVRSLAQKPHPAVRPAHTRMSHLESHMHITQCLESYACANQAFEAKTSDKHTPAMTHTTSCTKACGLGCLQVPKKRKSKHIPGYCQHQLHQGLWAGSPKGKLTINTHLAAAHNSCMKACGLGCLQVEKKSKPTWLPPTTAAPVPVGWVAHRCPAA